MHDDLARDEVVDKVLADLALLIERRNAIDRKIALLEALAGCRADRWQNIYYE